MSEGLAQGPYVVVSVGFEPATIRTEGTALTTEPQCPTNDDNAFFPVVLTHKPPKYNHGFNTK